MNEFNAQKIVNNTFYEPRDEATSQNIEKGIEPNNMQNTSREKFDRVYEQYKNLIMKLAVDRIHNYHTAQEICQTTFMEYYIKMDTIADEFVKPWLMLVAKNASIDYLRRACNRREQAGLEVVETSSFLLANRNNVEEMVTMVSNNGFIDKILLDLKSSNMLWYEVVVAVSIQDRPQAEVAEELGISQQMLRSRLYRAREWIRKKYGDEYDFGK